MLLAAKRGRGGGVRADFCNSTRERREERYVEGSLICGLKVWSPSDTAGMDGVCRWRRPAKSVGAGIFAWWLVGRSFRMNAYRPLMDQGPGR